MSCYGEVFPFRTAQEIKVLRQLLKFIPLMPRTLPQAHCIIHKVGYSILYDTRLKVPVYTYECLKEEDLAKEATRGNLNFTQDKEVPAPNRSKNTDYAHSGYHKGHSRPAADAVESTEAMQDTFKLSNAFPENPTLNLGYWKSLEMHVRELVKKSRCVEVFTGCLFLPKMCKDGIKRVAFEVIGEGHVAVPTHCYKVLFIHKKQRIEQVAYVLPNASLKPGKTLDVFLKTVEEIQSLSGVIFNTWIAQMPT
jgi:DNA/RNA endonuclease G (NUC1)